MNGFDNSSKYWIIWCWIIRLMAIISEELFLVDYIALGYRMLSWCVFNSVIISFFLFTRPLLMFQHPMFKSFWVFCVLFFDVASLFVFGLIVFALLLLGFSFGGDPRYGWYEIITLIPPTPHPPPHQLVEFLVRNFKFDVL